ncbi:MAG TPA: PAS domain-containing protein, partial [Blastocatellia bacterium]|nr:PAS domain-containing protein [Blastocatellia bacterium]
MASRTVSNDLTVIDAPWLITELYRLSQAAARPGNGANISKILDDLTRTLAGAIGAEMSTLHLVDEAAGELALNAAIGLPEEYMRAVARVPIRPDVGACGRAVWTGEVAVIEDMRADARWAAFLPVSEPAGLRAVWSVPIISARGETLGTFAAYYRTPRRPDQKELNIAQAYARQAAIAIENALLYQQAERARAQLESIIDQMPEGILIARAADRALMLVNRAAKELMELPAGTPVGDFARYVTLQYPDSAAVSADEWPMARALSGETGREREYLCARPDGELRHWLFNYGPLQNSDGSIFGGIVIFRDISAHKRAEQRLLRTTSELEAIFQALPGLYFRLNAEGVFLDCRAGRAADLYAPPEVFLGKRIQEILPPESADRLYQALVKAIATKSTITVEYTLPMPAGEQIFEAQLAPFLEDQAIAVVRNITERRQSEQALRVSEQWFSKAFNLSPHPMAIHHYKDGRYFDVNDSFLRTLGFTREELIGRTSLDVNTWGPPQDRENFLRLLRERKPIKNLEMRFRTRGGELRTGLVSAEVVELAGERFVLIAMNDITEHKRAEEALRASEERFSKAFNASPLPMSMRRLHDGTYVDINETYLRAIGKDKADAIGRTPDELGAWQDSTQSDRLMELLRQGKSVRNMEVGF